MVSALWKASSEGDLLGVQELLKEATSVDIEIKDHTGVTPLIAAIQSGHVEIVRVLLEKGADPTNSSSQGRPDQLTADPTILGLLSSNQNASAPNGIPHQEHVEGVSGGPENGYPYGPSPVGYGYYGPPPHLPDGPQYYPPPPAPAGGDHSPNGGAGNLPPPEIARYIPCRYFPACRYGASCMFLHPGQTPYYQGPPQPPPPHQYMPYEPMPQAYPPNFYPPPPNFQSPTNGPLSPPPHPGHARSPSEAIMPMQGPPFSPNGPPAPYPPMSPTGYPHPGQPPVPMSMSPLPPMPPPGALPPHSPNMYSPPNGVPPFDGPSPFPPNGIVPSDLPSVGINGDAQPVFDGPIDPQSMPTMPRGDGQHRRGGVRRTSFPTSRKQPCLFFPAGKCKNGDDCRFPHVLPGDVNGPPQNYFTPRNGFRPRQHNNNGYAALSEKFANMNVRENPPAPNPIPQDQPPQSQQQQPIQAHPTSRTSSTDSTRQRFQNGGKPHHHNNHNGVGPRNSERRPAFPPKQRVPNADEFPVLAGSATPSARSPGLNGWAAGNGFNAPTAAQILQAPAPRRENGTSASTSKDVSKEPSTRGTTPDSTKGAPTKAEPNGMTNGVVNGAIVNGIQPTHDQPVTKLPVSFAAAAAAAPEPSREISLTA